MRIASKFIFLFLIALNQLEHFISPKRAFAYPLLSEACKSSLTECYRQGALTYVSVYGTIVSEDLHVFRQIDSLLPSDAAFPIVYVNSGGGEILTSMEIGRILRRRNATVISGSPIFPGKSSQCSSACTLLAAGATTRLLTHIGIHQGYERKETACNSFHLLPLSEFFIRRNADYLAEMGIPKEFQIIKERTTIERFEHIYFNPEIDAIDQTIVKLGFYQPDKTNDSLTVYTQERDENFPTTQEYNRNASAYGSVAAKWSLVELLVEENNERGIREALDILNNLSEANDPRAHYLIGNYYLHGYGTEADASQAIQHYLEAAELGVAEAQYIIGQDALKNGSLTDASFWLGQSASQGLPSAVYSMCEMSMRGQMFSSSYVSKIKWCRVAVQLDGDSYANTIRELKIDEWSLGMTTSQRRFVIDLSIRELGKRRRDFSKCTPGMDLF